MDEMIARLEAAIESNQESAIGDTISYAVDAGWLDERLAAHAWRCFHAGAYESAALTLVPDGCRFTIEQSVEGRWFDATIFKFGEADEFIGDTDPAAKTPALALCVACLRARDR